jgi:hypothetical protein
MVFSARMETCRIQKVLQPFDWTRTDCPAPFRQKYGHFQLFDISVSKEIRAFK